MIDILKQINEATSGSAMVVGGVARWLNGDYEAYDKKWIDVCVTPEAVQGIKSLGKVLELPNGTSFPFPTLDQFLIKIVPEGVDRKEGYVLDVFVEESIENKYSLKAGIKSITAEADLEWHKNLNLSLDNDITKEKLLKLQQLYNI